MSARFHIVKEFGFEAAHYFGHKPEGHENTRVHGHSFKAEVALTGEPDAASGCVVDFEIRNGIAWIALNRPEKMNAINDDVLNGLRDAITRLTAAEEAGAA